MKSRGRFQNIFEKINSCVRVMKKERKKEKETRKSHQGIIYGELNYAISNKGTRIKYFFTHDQARSALKKMCTLFKS